MSLHARIGGLIVAALGTAAMMSCGSSSGATEFDSQELNDNRAAIQTNADDAGLVFVGTITSLGTAPNFWSGIAISSQGVTYTVDEVLKGTYTESSITVNHMLVDGTRQAADTPELNSSIFVVGASLIVFAQQNTDIASLGSDWEGPLYLDVDPNYGTIPYSQENAEVVESMISSPSAQVLGEEKDLAYDVGDGLDMEKTLVVSGSEADVQSFNNLLDQCKAKSSTLSSLVSQVQNDETRTVTLNLVRNEERIFVDSFNGRKVDVKDLEDWGEGCNQRTDPCQLFGHVIQEYWHAEVTGDGYAKSHETAIKTENQIRKDLGKTTVTTGHFGVRKGGDLYMQTPYDGSTELLKIIDGANVGEVTIEISPPAAPTNLSADNSTSCKIVLTWTDNADNETGYSLERKTGADGTWEQLFVGEISADMKTWTNAGGDGTGLELGKTYCYRIRAYRSVDSQFAYSSYSNEVCAEKK